VTKAVMASLRGKKRMTFSIHKKLFLSKKSWNENDPKA